LESVEQAGPSIRLRVIMIAHVGAVSLLTLGQLMGHIGNLIRLLKVQFSKH
jgi:hypothetical protein